jgi:hypothetical protein
MYVNQWTNNINIVPYDILYPMLSVKDLSMLSITNRLFRTTVYHKVKNFTIEIKTVSQGVAISKTFKNCNQRFHLKSDNKNDDIRLLKKLTWLQADDGTITNEEIMCLTNLEELKLDKNKLVTDFGLKTLKKLTYLKLSWNEAKITNGAFKKFDNLMTLNLNSFSWQNWFSDPNFKINYFNDKCLDHCPNLTNLSLRCTNVITDKGLKKLNKLVRLDICNNYTITNYGIKHMISLKELNADINSNIGSDGVINLVNLEILTLFDNKEMTNEGLVNLVNLTELDLGDQWEIDDDGISHLKKLTKLSLSFNDVITDAAISNLPELTSLNLFCNHKISEECVAKIPKLKHLNVSGTKSYTQLVSDKFIAELAQKGIEITYK